MDAYLCVYTKNNEDRTVAFGGAGYSVSSSDALKFHSYYGSEPAGTVIDGGVRFHEVLSPAKLVLSPDSMIYTGDPVTLGSALNGSRYTLTYAKNGASVDQLKEAGTYSVSVTGRNHYSGSVTKNFVINMPYNMPEPTFTVTNSGSTFTVTRSVSWKAQTVYYRTVGLSAIAGVHFTDASGTLTFDVGETSKTVTVTELSGFGTVFKYQSGTSRTYRFEVLDEGGFRLAYKNKSVSCRSSTSVVASDFEVKNVTVFTDTVSVTDGGYDHVYHDVPVSAGYFGAYAAKEYLTATGAQLRMTVSFNAREKDDGYQYIQIYANDTTHVDTGAKDGDPGTLEYSYYMAGFTIDGNVSSTYYPYVFPLTSKGDACGSQTHPWSGNEKGNLVQQYFKSGQRASDGRLIIPTNLNSLRIRFNASGNISDMWYVKDVYANIQATDTAAPTLYNNTTSYITVSSGPYMTGNTVYVSVPFSEIVAVTGTPSLSTTWGTLSYISGSGSNVLTFAGLISASVGTTLGLNSISGTVKDLSGNQFTAYSAVSKSYSLAVAESFAFPVVYDLDGGSLPSGQSNPGTYTFTDTFTLANPVKDGHVFAGWVGTDLAERTETVTVPAGEHKNRYYKAEWRPVVSFVDYDGTELASYDFEINDVPEYTGETPARADDVTADETVTYAFAGWSDGVSEYRAALPAVTGPVTYTATYDPSHYYLVTFENHDGTVLQQSRVLAGSVPEYTGTTPAKTSTAQYDFIFTGWDKQPAAVTGSETYTAVYSNDLRQYTVTFKNYDGTVLQSGPVYYGGTPAYSGETPSRPASGSVTGYFFAGWSPEISAVTGAAEYTAQFDALYTGTFGDGLSWTLFQGTLTVSGSGNMPNFGSYDNTPWYNYRNSITAVVIEGGIIIVNNYAFSNFNNITSVTLCEGVTAVGMYAFRNCRSLNTVYLPRSMKTIYSDAFVNDSALLADNGGNVYYAGSQTEWNGMSIRNGNGPLPGANRHYALLSVDVTDSLTPSRQIICSTSAAAENDTVTVTVKTADGVTCTGVTVTYDGNRALQATAGGTVTAECAKANFNDMIKLTAEPEPGYVFEKFVCTDNYGDPVEVTTVKGEYYLTMPFSDVTVTAQWRRLSFDTASVTLQNDLKINFKVRNEFFASGDCSAPYAIFEMNGRTVTVRDHETTIVNGKEYLVFSFLNVAPDMMNETITATLCASKNGTEIRSTPVTYSISQYCRDLLGVTENRRLKMLLVDMLNYGAATQTYTGRGTDNLANKDLTDGQRMFGTQAEPALASITNTKHRTVQSPEARWKAASLNLNDSITMQFKFSLDDMTGVTVVVEDENGIIDTIPADKITETGGLHVVRLNGYTAAQMRDPVYLTVCRGGSPIGNTLAYSVESYAYAKKNGADANLAALVTAMMKYGDSAKAYAK